MLSATMWTCAKVDMLFAKVLTYFHISNLSTSEIPKSRIFEDFEGVDI